jgi:hypothetical protein
MRYIDLIAEGRDSPIYHQMKLWSPKTKTLLSSDILQAIWTHDIPGIGPVKGHSFSRNPRLSWANMQLIVDQAKLASRYKIIPLDGDYVHTQGAFRDRRIKPDQTSLAEEFVVGDINSMHKYLLGIKIDVIRESNPAKIKELLLPVMDYSYKYNIRLYIPHSMTSTHHSPDPHLAFQDYTTNTKTLLSDTELQKRYPNGLNIEWYDDPRNPVGMLPSKHSPYLGKW